jgi:hypothetical protein
MTKGRVLIAAIAALACGVMFAPGGLQAMTCAGGYHVDAHGHCQPNNPLPPLRPCPPGFYPHSAPTWKGYRCKNYP